MLIKARGRLNQVDFRHGNKSAYGGYSAAELTGELSLEIPPEYVDRMGPAMGDIDVYIDLPDTGLHKLEAMEKRAIQAEMALKALRADIKALAK